MRRIAAPMVGGMVSATVLTLVVIPVIFEWVRGWRLPAEVADSAEASPQLNASDAEQRSEDVPR